MAIYNRISEGFPPFLSHSTMWNVEFWRQVNIKCFFEFFWMIQCTEYCVLNGRFELAESTRNEMKLFGIYLFLYFEDIQNILYIFYMETSTASDQLNKNCYFCFSSFLLVWYFQWCTLYMCSIFRSIVILWIFFHNTFLLIFCSFCSIFSNFWPNQLQLKFYYNGTEASRKMKFSG